MASGGKGLWGGVLLGGAVTLQVACQNHAATAEVAGVAEQGLTREYVVTLHTPHGMGFTTPVIVGEQGVVIKAHSEIAESPAAPVVAMGDSGVVAGPDARLAELWSRGKVELWERTAVAGKVHAQTVVLGNRATTGGLDTVPVFDPTEDVKWTVTWPATNQGNVSVSPHGQRTLTAGAFGEVRVAPDARLRLGAGTYYFGALELERSALLELQQDTGPIVIYVAGKLAYRGGITVQGGAAADLALVVLGKTPVELEAPFSGALVAPQARLTLRGAGDGHGAKCESAASFVGFFAAKSVEVGPEVKVLYRAPSALLGAAGLGVGQCAQLLVPRKDLSGIPQQDQYQRDIARYCSMVGANSCTTDIAARVNVDETTVAISLVTEVITPARYLAVVRDRVRKERAAEDDAARAKAICGQPDADRDLVPDSLDRCPGTPPLTATFDDGCPDNKLPDAPSASDVSAVLNAGKVMLDRRCSGASPLPDAVAGAFYYPAARQRGSYVVAGRVTNQPATCPIWYVFDVDAPQSDGTRVNYQVAFRQEEESTALVGLAKPVPRGFIQFNPLPTDPGTRGLLGDAGGHGSVRFRIRTMNGGGMHSNWSGWKTTTKADCFALGFDCGN